MIERERETESVSSFWNLIASSIFIVKEKKQRHPWRRFGFDFALDEHFKVWLIEVNHRPGMSLDSHLDCFQNPMAGHPRTHY